MKDIGSFLHYPKKQINSTCRDVGRAKSGQPKSGASKSGRLKIRILQKPEEFMSHTSWEKVQQLHPEWVRYKHSSTHIRANAVIDFFSELPRILFIK